MNFKKRVGMKLLSFFRASGTGERVPMPVQAPRGEDKWIVGIERFGQAFGMIGTKASPTVECGKLQVGVEPSRGHRRARHDRMVCFEARCIFCRTRPLRW